MLHTTEPVNEMGENNLLNSFSDFPPVSQEEWLQKIKAELKGKSFDDLIHRPVEGISLMPFYTADDLKNLPPLHSQKETAGWEIRHDIPVQDVSEANRAAHDALANGVESIGFALPGFELNENRMDGLLAGINLKEHPLHFTGVSSAGWRILSEYFQKHATVSPHLKGSVAFNNPDEISTAVLRQAANLAVRYPGFHWLSVSASAESENVTDRMVSLIESANDFLTAGNSLKIPARYIAGTLRFSFTLTSDYFQEIAALRALRHLWGKNLKENFAIEDAPVFIHAENLPVEKAEQDAHLNILRATTIAMAAIAGGCDSLCLNPSVIPGQTKSFSERIYRNVQLLLKYEAGFDALNNVAAGSYYIEALTRKIIDVVDAKISA